MKLTREAARVRERCSRWVPDECSRRRVGRGRLCSAISGRCGQFAEPTLYPSIMSWQSASLLPHTSSTQPRTQAERIGRCSDWTALSALRLNKLTAPLSYCLTGLRAAPGSRCFPSLASLDARGIWPAARLFYRTSKQVLWFSFALFLGLNNACAAEGSPRDYEDLKLISFFGSISVSVHLADSAKPAKSSGLSSEDLTQFMRIQFGRYFSGVPFRGIDASHWSDEENRRAMGRFSCRVWIEGDDSPVAYQVKCQISTSDHLNIIEDASLGYGPKDKVATIVRQQIDRMVESFALIFSRVRSE